MALRYKKATMALTNVILLTFFVGGKNEKCLYEGRCVEKS